MTEADARETVAVGGQGALNDGGPTAVGHPAGSAIEVCDIITTAIKRRNGKQANLRVRDEENVHQ